MNIVSAAFVPMAPLLFRHLSGAADPVAGLREASVAAVSRACVGATEVVVLCPVGGREAPGEWHDPSRTLPLHGEPRSLAAQVGEHLLALAGVALPATYVECTDGAVSGEQIPSRLLSAERQVALVVLGEGAAARSQGAPGHIDERSFPYDDALAAALAAGDVGALATLAGAPEAADLLVTGRHTWPVAAALVPRADGSRLEHRSDPFGLTYVVATWTP